MCFGILSSFILFKSFASFGCVKKIGYLKNLGIEGRIILKLILKNGCGEGVNWIYLAHDMDKCLLKTHFFLSMTTCLSTVTQFTEQLSAFIFMAFQSD